MRRVIVIFFAWLLTLILPVLSGERAAAGTTACMSVDELRRGMRGVGRTVFQGTRIDTFQVEILGVLRNVFGPRSDMILARLSGGPLEKAGVIAGMSGSPVYIGGKLVGAVAYSIGAFSKEPIAGITPIAEMVEALERPQNSGSSVGFRLDGDAGHTLNLDVEAGELKPVATPLVMSGFAPQVVAELREDLLPMGLLPVRGGGGTDASLPAGPFEPGAALGVQLVRGDFSITGIGTLTFRDGDRVIGFGHPMLWGGSTSMPMTAAYIHQVLPSQYISFKLGMASHAMGAIVQDRASGIAGIVGQDVDMVPTEVEVRSPGKRETFRMEVLKHRDFAPLLVREVVASALISAEKLAGEATVRTRTRIVLAGYPPLELANVYASTRGVGEAVLGATTPLAQLMQNSFEPVRVEEVAFELDVEEHIRAAAIDAVRLRKTRFEPGDTLYVTVYLRPYLGKTLQKVDTMLVIPSQVQKGRLTLRVASARVHRAWESKRVPGEYKPQDLPHLLRLLEKAERNDTLILDLLSSKQGITVKGREMAALPPSVLSAFRLSPQSGTVKRVTQTLVDRIRLPTDYVLSGGQTVLISVGQEDGGVVFGGQPKLPEKQQK